MLIFCKITGNIQKLLFGIPGESFRHSQAVKTPEYLYISVLHRVAPGDLP